MADGIEHCQRREQAEKGRWGSWRGLQGDSLRGRLMWRPRDMEMAKAGRTGERNGMSRSRRGRGTMAERTALSVVVICAGQAHRQKVRAAARLVCGFARPAATVVSFSPDDAPSLSACA